MTRGVPAQAAISFLSPEWFEALGAALGQIAVVEEPSIVLGQIVTDVSSAGGEVRYSIVMGGGRPARLTPHSLDTAEVVLVAAYADALAMARGEVTGASLLAAGRIKIRGDAARLVEAAASVEAVAAAARQLHRIVT